MYVINTALNILHIFCLGYQMTYSLCVCLFVGACARDRKFSDRVNQNVIMVDTRLHARAPTHTHLINYLS